MRNVGSEGPALESQLEVMSAIPHGNQAPEPPKKLEFMNQSAGFRAASQNPSETDQPSEL